MITTRPVSEWSQLPFDDVIDFQEGPGILAKDFRDEGVPLVRLSGLWRRGSVLVGCNYLDRKTVAKRWSHFALAEGDVLLSTSASLGRIAIVGSEGVGAIPYTGIIRMRPRDTRLLASFIRFLLEGPDFQRQAEMVGAGSVIRHFGPSHLRTMTVRLPPLAEQRAIGQILGVLDDTIELNRRMSETLEAMARALFKSWFVDFDPVRAKAEGRATGISKAFADLFPARLVASDLGHIPEGWAAKPLGDWVNTMSGGTPAKGDASYWGGDTPWISPKVMTSIHADEADAYVSKSAIGNGTRLAPAGSTLVMVRGMGLHEGVRVSFARHDVTFNQDVKALVGSSIDSILLLFSLLHSQRSLLERVESSGHGTGKLPTEVLLSLRIVMPTGPVQSRLAGPFRDLNERIAIARDKSRTLSSVRDTLLPKLISGEFRVTDAERFIRDATA